MKRLKAILTHLCRMFLGVPAPDFSCPDVRGLANGTRCYELIADYTVRVRLLGFRVEITVLAGTLTDGASVPRALWGICGAPMDPPRVAAAVVHDWLYAAQILSRGDADWIYAQIQAQAGIAYWRILVEYLALRLFGQRHWDDAAQCDTAANAETGRIVYLTPKGCPRWQITNKKGLTQMKSTVSAAIVVAIATALGTGCQTRLTVTKHAEAVLPIQEVVKVNGEDRVIVTRYDRASGGWEATARSPLYAKEGLKDLDLGVGTNGTLTLKAGEYARDLSPNAVELTREMFAGGAKLIGEIGVAYAKIAGGAQADTVLTVAQRLYQSFTGGGGDPANAKLTTTDTSITLSDGSICTTCTPDGTCTTGKCGD